MNRSELKKAFEEKLIDEEKYKEALLKIELAPKKKRTRRRLPAYITLEQFNKLMKYPKLKKHHKFAFALGYLSGLRVSEIVNLKKENIDLKAKKIWILDTKFNKDRVVPLPKGVPKSWFDKQIPLKCGVRSLQRAFKSTLKRVGIKDSRLVFHSLRHGFATNCINSKVPLNQIQLLMGHDNIQSTSIYIHANPTDALESYEKLF